MATLATPVEIPTRGRTGGRRSAARTCAGDLGLAGAVVRTRDRLTSAGASVGDVAGAHRAVVHALALRIAASRGTNLDGADLLGLGRTGVFTAENAENAEQNSCLDSGLDSSLRLCICPSLHHPVSPSLRLFRSGIQAGAEARRLLGEELDRAGIDSASIPPAALGDAHEAMLGADSDGARRARGSFYTPAPVVEHVLDMALEPILGEASACDDPARALGALRICDPACGTGHFLAGAGARIARRLAQACHNGPGSDESCAVQSLSCLVGADLDPLAVQLCRIRLWIEGGGGARLAAALRSAIRQGDALLDLDLFPRDTRFDVVLGNPPFLSQLDARTARSRSEAQTLGSRFPGASMAYTDASAMFLCLGVDLCRAGGRVGMLQPQSLLSSRDAAGVRGWVLERASLTGLWLARDRVFDASVNVAAVALHVGAVRSTRVQRWIGPNFEPRPTRRVPISRLARGQTWSPVMADTIGVPCVRLARSALLEQIASAGADFRDEYYGLRGAVFEGETDREDEPISHPRLITTGLIDPLECRWGVSATRFDRRAWLRPRVDLDRLDLDGGGAGGEGGRMGAWATRRLVPKILLATQTKVLEPVVDEQGRWLPVTPTISVMPDRPEDLWLVAAVLCAPPVTAWAMARYAGAGLSPEAIRLSARQVEQIPLPTSRGAWEVAAGAARQAQRNAKDRPVLLLEVARLMCDAYRLSRRTRDRTMAWWQGRLPRRRAPCPAGEPREERHRRGETGGTRGIKEEGDTGGTPVPPEETGRRPMPPG